MGQLQIKDGTAQGVAKVRHYEALHEPSKRLYYDPYAHAMYPGSFAQTWLGEGGTQWLYRVSGFPGLLECLTIRTKWLDDQVLKASTEGAQQLVVLGAGYDTRGFRLDLPQQNFCVFEVDQTEVQTKKIRNLKHLCEKKDCDETIASRMDTFVKFIPVDFNTDNIDEKLTNAAGYSVDKCTIVTMEGVTQYIPKSSTADTLARLKKVMPAGSTLLITYVDQNCFDDPSKCGPPKVVRRVMRMASTTGEPWISSWTCDGFKSFLSKSGCNVLSDTTARDYVEEHLAPLNRGSKDGGEPLGVERFVVATFKES